MREGIVNLIKNISNVEELDGLTDAIAMNTKSPETFHIPTPEEMDALSEGDFFKICRNDERFWCHYLGTTKQGRLMGEVSNNLICNDDLELGDVVVVQRKHIYDVMFARPKQVYDKLNNT